jgi:hypothetical protein
MTTTAAVSRTIRKASTMRTMIATIIMIVLGQHEEFIVPIMKKDFKNCLYREIVDAAETELRMLEWEGINPYKVYELFKNFRPYVPVQFQ